MGHLVPRNLLDNEVVIDINQVMRLASGKAKTFDNEILERGKALEPAVIVDELQNATEFEVIDLNIFCQSIRFVESIDFGPMLNLVCDVNDKVASLLNGLLADCGDFGLLFGNHSPCN